MPPRPLRLPLPALLLVALAAGCASSPAGWPGAEAGREGREEVLDARRERIVSFGGMVEDLATVRMVFVGESHTNREHHAIQLRILRGLADRRPHLLLGMEMFQAPFQPVLDRWSAGELAEADFLREVDWYGQWNDWDLYAPLLRFARDRGIPVVALNCPREIVREIGREGLDGISPWMRARIPPDIDTGVKAHQAAIREVFSSHPGMSPTGRPFQRFYEAQCTWDETMAANTARALAASPHPDAAILVLAGGMHVKGFHAIPERARRRNGLDYRTVLPVERDGPDAKEVRVGPGRPADYLLATGPTPAAPPARLGVALRGGDARVKLVVPGSAAAAAGLREGDDLRTVDGRPVADAVDLRLALEMVGPGDRVEITWARDGEVLRGEAVFEAPAPPPAPGDPAGEGGGTPRGERAR